MRRFNEKSRASYNKKADHYDDTFDGRFTQKFKGLLLETVTLAENCSVLDVACGNGSLLAELNSKVPIKGFGVDIADRMIENAAAKNPGMEFHMSGCEVLPFQNKTMDIITVCAAYHHFPDVKAFAAEAGRVIKPGGKLYIADVYYSKTLRLLLNPFIPLSRAGDVRFYSPEEIIGNFKPFGFDNPDVRIVEHIQIVSLQRVQTGE